MALPRRTARFIAAATALAAVGCGGAAAAGGACVVGSSSSGGACGQDDVDNAELMQLHSPRAAAASATAAKASAVAEQLRAKRKLVAASADATDASVVVEQLRTQRKLAAIDEAFAAVRGAGRYFDAFSPEQYIDKAFENVTGLGRFWPSNIHPDTTWEECTSINWTKVALTEEGGKIKLPSVEAMLKELHVHQCFTGGEYVDDPTCIAVKAAIQASIKMQGVFEEGPKFANYSVVSWGHFPSWVNGTVTNLDYSEEMPVQASLLDASGVLGYGICDVLRTVLTQSADQMMTGTCSYVASVAALSHKAPAVLIKLGTRLLWTGQITADMGPACPKIFQQQPGLIPFADRGQWRPEFYSNPSESPCTGNAVDCANAKGSPNQNAGLTFMWSQSMISNWMSKNWGFCLNDTTRAGLTYPGQSGWEAAVATRNQGGWYNSMMWECNSVMDPKGKSCRFLINENTCAFFPYKKCMKKLALAPAYELTEEVFDPLLVMLRSQAWEYGHLTEAEQETYVVPRLKEELQDFPPLLEYTDLLQDLSASSDLSLFKIHQIDGPNYPCFTEKLLNETCEAFTNMLIIDATVLQVALSYPGAFADLKRKGLPVFGNFASPSSGHVLAKSNGCNHAVYLEACDYKSNNYVIWTWGTTVNLTREVILGWPTDQPAAQQTLGAWTWNTGSVCGSIVADQITVE